MPVDSEHQEYKDSVSKWGLVRDCVAGDSRIKQAGNLYLPYPDNSADRYKQYSMRAIFTNVIKPTSDSMVGMAFRLAPNSELPLELEYLQDNATGSGISLQQLAKNITASLLHTGRHGLLVDYPQADGIVSAVKSAELNLQASIKSYPAESIINWKTQIINGIETLTLVVLKENYAVAVDEFESDSFVQYRVLSLVNGVYSVQIWRDEKPFSQPVQPTNSVGNALNYIPFIAVGSCDNNINVDPATLYDMSVLNIGHYRNSADKEEGLFLHGQPMLHLDIGDTNPAQWQELNPNGVQVGARRGLITSGGGSATLLQSQANDAVSQEMIEKRKEMIEIGARLIQQGGQAETATAAMIRYAGTNSTLTNIVQNVSSALEAALAWCGEFMGATGTPIYEINNQFYEKGLDASQIMAAIQMYDRGAIAKQDLRNSARKTGMIEQDRTDEDIDDDVEEISPIE